MSHLMNSWVFSTAVVILLLMIFPIIRSTLGILFLTFLTPSLLATMRVTFLWVWWALKKILTWHQTMLKHSVMPRSVAFPSLEQRREKSQSLSPSPKKTSKRNRNETPS